MADQPLSASDYLAQAQRAAQRSAPPATGELMQFGKSAQARSGAQDPLSWLIDIVTRPLSGVTNALQSGINRSAESAQAARKGDIGTVLANGARSALPGADFLSGMFSTDREQHRTFSDVIEESTDRLAPIVNPEYVDRQDNVNPVVKGIAGFAGDVALDPLTYITGGMVKAGVAGLRAGAAGAKEAAKAGAQKIAGAVAPKIARETLETADGLLPSAGKAAPKAAEATEELAVPPAPTREVPEGFDTATIAKGDSPEFMSSVAESIAAATSGRIARQAATPEGTALRTVLDSIQPMTIGAKVMKTTQAAAKVLGKFSGGRTPEGALVDERNTWLSEAKRLVESGDLPPMKGMDKAILAASQGNQQALDRLRQWHQTTYLPAFAAAGRESKYIDPFGRVTTPPMVEIPKAERTLLDTRATLDYMLRNNEQAVTEALGKDLVAVLQTRTSAKSLEETLGRLRRILDGAVDVTRYKNLGTETRALLGQLGIDASTLPVGLPRASAKVLPEGETLTSSTARLAAESKASPETLSLAEDTMRKVIYTEFDRKFVGKKYPHQSKTGTLRTDDAYGVGTGRRQRELNTYTQYTAAKSLLQDITTKLNDAGIGRMGVKTASEKRAAALPAMRLMERAFEEHGVPATIGVGKERIPLGTSQIIDILDSTSPSISRWAMFNPSTAVAWTNLSDAVYSAIKGGTPDTIEALIRNTSTRYGSNKGKPIDGNSIITAGRFGPNTLQPDDMVRELTEAIVKATPMLRATVAENATRLGARQIDETYQITNQVIQELEDLYQTPGAMGTLLESIARTDSRVTELAREAGALKVSHDVAEVTVEQLVPKVDRVIAKGSMTVAQHLDEIDNVTSALTDSAKVSQRTMEDVLDAEDMPNLSKLDPEDMEDFDANVLAQMNRGIFAKTMRVFSRRFGNEQTNPIWRRAENLSHTLYSHYARRLSDIAKSGMSKEDLASELLNARRGTATSAVGKEFTDLWGQMFGVAGRAGALVDNAFFANGNNINHINEMFARNGLKQVFDVDEAIKLGKLEGISPMAAASRQAADWDITDPLDEMARLYKTFLDMQTQQTIVQQFVKMAKDFPGFTSTKPKPGFKIAGSTGGKSIFAKYMPQDLYIQEDLLSEMHVIDNLMQQTMDLSGPLGKFVREVYQPAQQAWKYGMTIPNPTHHIRNMVSDYSLTYYALGTKGAKKANEVAFQAMAARNNYDGWDAVRAMQVAGTDGTQLLPDAGKVFASGRLGELTPDALTTAMNRRGNLVTFKYIEQINEAAGGEGTGALAKLWDKVQGTGVVEKMGGISEARDHFSRLQHGAQFVIQNIDSTKYKTLDEMLDAASDHVRKWHPDGTDMTRAEQYFRLVIPFYSWQRKAIPLIVESMLMNPGRVMSIPKAQFNFAVAMGVNPDSLSDPFPQDQLFPSYLTEQVQGPAFELDGAYYGINPGFAANDILNEWGGGPEVSIRNALGSVSPLLRAPFEIAAGGQVGTGARINDYSDYVDSQIPGVGHLSRMSGYSVSGSLASMLQGQGLDPQFQIAQGNKDPVAGPGLAVLNWLTGMGISPMSSKNQINYAEIEKRNAEGEQRGF